MAGDRTFEFRGKLVI